MAQQFANNARALLTASITSTATSIVIESAKADLFPVANVGSGSLPSASSWFKATLQDSTGAVEIVAVRTRTAGSGVLSNVIRGYDGTTALAFVVGTVIGIRITAEDVQTALDLPNQNSVFTGDNSFTGTNEFTTPITGDLIGDVTGNVTGNVTGTAANVTSTVVVANGGTGATSFTSGALLKGAGTGAVTAASAADIVGQIGSTAVANATTAANGGVTSVNGSTGAVTVQQIGVSQTWQNPSRSLGTTYTNSTGRPIQVTSSVYAQGGTYARAYVGGVMILDSRTVDCCGIPQISYFPFSFIVPNGTTYQITGGGFTIWAELR